MQFVANGINQLLTQDILKELTELRFYQLPGLFNTEYSLNRTQYCARLFSTPTRQINLAGEDKAAKKSKMSQNNKAVIKIFKK